MQRQGPRPAGPLFQQTPAIPSDQVGDAAVLPQLEVVKRPIEHRPLSAVAAGLFITIMIGLRRYRAMVETSMPVIWNAPSPTSTIGRKSGFAIWASTAADIANPSDR
jgi:hypothetical protein